MALVENMQLFKRVVELGSMSAAARQLRLSPAVVSQRIRQLEDHLGVRLLNRSTRQLQPTENGHIFYRHCFEVLDAVDRAESSVAGAHSLPAGTLRVTAPLVFGRRILAPLIPRFHASFPHIQLRLRLADHLIDLLREGIDIAVRMAELRDSSLVVRKIADCPRVLCAAPSYLSQHGSPEEPEDLLLHACLLLRFPGVQQYEWSLRAPDGMRTVRISGPFDADDGEVLTNWALEGRGIILKPIWEVAEHLTSGALRVVLRDYPPDPVSLALLFPHRGLLPAKSRVFSDFVVEETRHYLADQIKLSAA